VVHLLNVLQGQPQDRNDDEGRIQAVEEDDLAKVGANGFASRLECNHNVTVLKQLTDVIRHRPIEVGVEPRSRNAIS